jgi:hypothetical protein
MLTTIKKTLTMLCTTGVLFCTTTMADSQTTPPSIDELLSISSTVGNKNAEYKVKEFFMYSCPHCQKLSLDEKHKKWKQKKTETGNVSFTLSEKSCGEPNYNKQSWCYFNAKMNLKHRCLAFSFNSTSSAPTGENYTKALEQVMKYLQQGDNTKKISGELKDDFKPSDDQDNRQAKRYNDCVNNIKVDDYLKQLLLKEGETKREIGITIINQVPSFVITGPQINQPKLLIKKIQVENTLNKLLSDQE